ncbi:UDP-N-acetylglucosamine 2-epimerase, partial [Bacillus canaveralius]
EGIEAGTLKLAGIEEEPIYQMATELLTDPSAYEKMAKAINPYGDGNASARICDAIRYYFKQTTERPADYKPE